MEPERNFFLERRAEELKQVCQEKSPRHLTARLEWEESLNPGDEVLVRWGYGGGFRAEGKARVVRVNRKSFRVELTEDVRPHWLKEGWPMGWSLSVPRANAFERWHFFNGVHPLNS